MPSVYRSRSKSSLVRSEWTLRDARRYLSSFSGTIKTSIIQQDFFSCVEYSYYYKNELSVRTLRTPPANHLYCVKDCLRWIDRLISEEGGHALLIGDRESFSERNSGDDSQASASQAGTVDHDAPSGESGSMQGAEQGCSGELSGDSPAGANEEHEPRTGEATSAGSSPAVGGCSVLEDNPESDSSDVARSGAPTDSRSKAPKACESSEVTGNDSPAKTEQPSGAKTEVASESDAGSCADEPDSPADDHAVDEQAHGNAHHSMKSKVTPGGQYIDRWIVQSYLSFVGKKDAREVLKSLKKLLKVIDSGGIEEIPRIDPKKFAVEILKRRCSFARAKRDEKQTAVTVIAVDTSGSCSAVCSELYACALATVMINASVLLIEHSNGQVLIERGYTRSLCALCVEIERLRRGRPIAGVLAFGDWDAGEEYRQLCEKGVPLYWLDSYSAKHGPKPASRNLRCGATGWKHQPVHWWQGVNTPLATTIALRAMCRPKR